MDDNPVASSHGVRKQIGIFPNKQSVILARIVNKIGLPASRQFGLFVVRPACCLAGLCCSQKTDLIAMRRRTQSSSASTCVTREKKVSISKAILFPSASRPARKRLKTSLLWDWHASRSWSAVMKQQINVLLVEDDREVRDSLARAIALENFRVVSAINTADALAQFSRNPIDICLLDLNLDGDSGWDVFEQLTELCPFLPIIVMSAQPERLTHPLAKQARACFQKPLLDLPSVFNVLNQIAPA